MDGCEDLKRSISIPHKARWKRLFGHGDVLQVWESATLATDLTVSVNSFKMPPLASEIRGDDGHRCFFGHHCTSMSSVINSTGSINSARKVPPQADGIVIHANRDIARFIITD